MQWRIAHPGYKQTEPGLSGEIVRHFPLWVREGHAVHQWVSLGPLSRFQFFFLLDLFFYCLKLRGVCSCFCGHWEYNRNTLFISQGHHKCLKSTEFWLESSPKPHSHFLSDLDLSFLGVLPWGRVFAMSSLHQEHLLKELPFLLRSFLSAPIPRLSFLGVLSSSRISCFLPQDQYCNINLTSDI